MNSTVFEGDVGNSVGDLIVAMFLKNPAFWRVFFYLLQGRSICGINCCDFDP